MNWRTAPVLLLDGPSDWAQGTVMTLPPGWLRHDPAKAARIAALPSGAKRDAMARQWGIAARKAAQAAGNGAVAAGPGVASLVDGPGVRVVRKGERVNVAPLRGGEPAKFFTPKGPEGWRMLHRRAWEYDGDAAAARRWLEQFAAGLGCDECRKDWRALVAENPPDLMDADSFFVSTVELHNAVNRRLGKPEVTVEAARERWREPVQRVEHAGAVFEEVVLI